MDEKKLIPPKKDFANHLHEYFNEVAKTLTGGLVNPLVNIVLPSFHQKRFENWCSEVYNALLELKDTIITLDELRSNYEFISIVKESMIIASKNHQLEKLNMLKVGILNSLIVTISFDSKLIYTRLIDNLSLTHIIILNIIAENLDSFKNLKKFDEIDRALFSFNSTLLFSKNELIFILNELDRNRLIKMSKDIEEEEIVKEASRFVGGYGDSDLPFLTVTEFGEQFLKFVLNQHK